MQNNIDNKEKQKAFIHSLDFMRLGQAINRGQWQSAAMIIQRMDRVAKDAGISRQGVHDLVKRCDKILE